MFALRQQVIRQTCQRFAKRTMSTATAASTNAGAEARAAEVQFLLKPLNLPWTAEQEAGLQKFKEEIRQIGVSRGQQVLSKKYPPYDEASNRVLKPTPTTSLPFNDVLGVPRQARQLWLFPVTFTVGIVVYTNILEYCGADFFTRPFTYLLEGPKRA